MANKIKQSQSSIKKGIDYAINPIESMSAPLQKYNWYNKKIPIKIHQFKLISCFAWAASQSTVFVRP
jgi:hypothetical protein